MIGLRKLVRFSLAMSFAVLALPAVADDDKFRLVMSGTGPFTATITNIGDDDSIESFRIIAPAAISAASINAAAGTATDEIPSSVVGIGTGSVTFNGIKVRKGQSIVVNLTASIDTCGSSQYTWGAMAWEGANASGDTFSLSPSSVRTTSVSTSCTFAWLTQPTNAVAGLNITGTAFAPTASGVSVQLLRNGTASTSTANVQLSGSCLAAPVSQAAVAGVATFATLTSNAAGGIGCKLTAVVASHTGPLSAAFDLYVPSLEFLTLPNNALEGVAITNTSFNTPPGSFVQVALKLNGAAPPVGFPATPISLSESCLASFTGNSATADTSNSYKPTFGTLNGTTPATACSLTASALGATSTAGNFNIVAFAPQGEVNCGQVLPSGPGIVGTPNPVNPLEVYGIRGPFDAKPTVCVAVDSEFTNGLDDDGTITHKWDTVKAPSGAWYYQLNGKLKTLVAGWPDPAALRPQVAWLFDSSGLPSNVHDGLTCLSSKLPRPYGRPAGGLPIGATSFTLDISNAPGVGFETDIPTLPFPIYIDQERMTATVTGTTWSVTRGDLGTIPAAHSASSYVMSTPLPPNLANTGVEQVCIVSVGWRLYEPGKYFWHVDAIDIGDGWVRVGN